MKLKSRGEKTVKELILKDDEFLQLTTAVEGSIGYKNLKDYRLSVSSDGRLIVEKRLLLDGDILVGRSYKTKIVVFGMVYAC